MKTNMLETFISMGLIFMLILVNAQIVISQSCLPDGITFSTQEEIDSFQIYYPSCTEIDGNVNISGANITNLNGLIGVSRIEGDLNITINNSLSNLHGLDSLSIVGGSIWIYGNDLLIDLRGVENLTNIFGSLIIFSNNNLTNLSGIENLKSIQGNFQIGLYIPFNETFIGNPSLKELAQMNNLISIGGSLFIVDNDSLTNLAGLNSLVSIAALFVGFNDVLNSLGELEHISSVAGFIRIQDNHALESLSGLENIAAGSIEDLLINNNDSLATCEVVSICEYLLDPGGFVNIQNNAPGCNSQEEVEQACQSEVHDETFISSISIYPNPTQGILNIKYQDEIEVHVYLSSGTRVLTTDQKEIDLTLFPTGLYFIKIITDKGIYFREIVKVQ